MGDAINQPSPEPAAPAAPASAPAIIDISSAVRAIERGAQSGAALEQIVFILGMEKDPAVALRKVTITALLTLGQIFSGDDISDLDCVALATIREAP